MKYLNLNNLIVLLLQISVVTYTIFLNTSEDIRDVFSGIEIILFSILMILNLPASFFWYRVNTRKEAAAVKYDVELLSVLPQNLTEYKVIRYIRDVIETTQYTIKETIYDNRLVYTLYRDGIKLTYESDITPLLRYVESTLHEDNKRLYEEWNYYYGKSRYYNQLKEYLFGIGSVKSNRIRILLRKTIGKILLPGKFSDTNSRFSDIPLIVLSLAGIGILIGITGILLQIFYPETVKKLELLLTYSDYILLAGVTTVTVNPDMNMVNKIFAEKKTRENSLIGISDYIMSLDTTELQIKELDKFWINDSAGIMTGDNYMELLWSIGKSDSSRVINSLSDKQLKVIESLKRVKSRDSSYCIPQNPDLMVCFTLLRYWSDDDYEDFKRDRLSNMDNDSLEELADISEDELMSFIVSHEDNVPGLSWNEVNELNEKLKEELIQKKLDDISAHDFSDIGESTELSGYCGILGDLYTDTELSVYQCQVYVNNHVTRVTDYESVLKSHNDAVSSRDIKDTLVCLENTMSKFSLLQLDTNISNYGDGEKKLEIQLAGEGDAYITGELTSDFKVSIEVLLTGFYSTEYLEKIAELIKNYPDTNSEYSIS